MAFLTIAAIEVPVRRDGADEQPDGQGKRRWTFATPSLATATYDALRAAIGTPTGAESERAWDGTLLTDRALVAIGGEFATVLGVTEAEVTMTAARFRHARIEGEPAFRLAVTLVLREP